MAVKLHGSEMCHDVPFRTDPRVCVRVETSRATYGWTTKLKTQPAGATAAEREAFAKYHLADVHNREVERRVECLCTWYAAVECMTETPIAELLIHGDVVVRMCEVFKLRVFANGDLWFDWTHARDMRIQSKAASLHAADVTAAIASAMSYDTAREFLHAHRIVGVGESVGIKRKRGDDDLVLRRGHSRKLTIRPVGKCAVPECAAEVCSVPMALCAPCATRLRGVFHAQTRSFVAKSYTRTTRQLIEVTGVELERALAISPREPTLPMFVEFPGPYHLPEDVSAHVLYVVRLCKERLARLDAAARVPDALAQEIVETPVGALSAAAFRPKFEAVYAKVRSLRK